MQDGGSGNSPLERVAGDTGTDTIAAFELLSSEVRLSILLALWEAYDPYAGPEAVSFSELYDRVPIDDSANFTYHLDKLTDHFVEKTDDGYELRNAGFVIVRAILAGGGLDDATVPPTDIGLSCHRCGAGEMAIRYRDEAVYLTCSECEGFTAAEEYPRGTIGKFWFDPAGLADRGTLELLAASVVRIESHNRMMEAGVCPACSGPIDESLQLCDEHTPAAGAVCPNCGTHDSARVRYICTVCKYRNRRPVELTVVDHPAVIAFYHDHGVDPRWDIDDIERCVRQLERIWAMDHSLRSTDPVRILVTVPCETDELELTLDAEWDVIDVRERA